MDWLTDVATWLGDQWSWFTAAIVAALTWFLGRLGVLATKRTDTWLENKVGEWDAWRAARTAAKRREHKLQERQTHLRRVEAERVGAQFRVREAKDDPGTISEVIGLDPKHPELRVRTQPVDSDEPRVTLIEWRQLSKSAEQQRHETARLDARSDDDADGWLRYERVDRD